MNRFAAVGINMDAATGKRVIVVAGTSREARTAFEGCAAIAPSLGASRILHANGNERIDYPNGGRIIFRSHRQGTRGHSADILYLDEGVDPEMNDINRWSAMVASLNTSRHPEIVRA